MKIETITINQLIIHEHHLDIIYSADKFNPTMLNEGYRYLSLAQEKSANTENLFWGKLGKEVNHQLGKSHEAEKLLNDFIQNNLFSNFTYFNILQPIYDFRIFKNLTQYPEVLQKIYSCNIQKPWCKNVPNVLMSGWV